MRRREFLTLVGVAAITSPFAARAQQRSTVPIVGFLAPGRQTYQGEFRRGLRDLGYEDGGNIRIVEQFAGGNDARLIDLARELVARPVDVIVATNSAATAAAMQVTSTIPIVMVTSSDPVGSGFVASLARPGNNVTGMSLLAPETALKQLELLKEIDAAMARIIVLWSPNNPGNVISLKVLQAAAPRFAVELLPVPIKTPDELEAGLNVAASMNGQGLLVLVDQVTIRRRADVVAFAKRTGKAAIYALREFAVAGGLMAYGASFSDLYYRSAAHVDKILRGAVPAELPVQQPTKFDLVINLTTAKALGLALPPSLLVRADEVIE